MPSLDTEAIVRATIAAFDLALQMWKIEAKFQNITIMAHSAIGKPGCLTGPSIESKFKLSSNVASLRNDERAVALSAGRGISNNFAEWQESVTVPGLPWYPSFAAFPAPLAPPTPNVPVPLVACFSDAMPKIIGPLSLRDAMMSELESGLEDKYGPEQCAAIFEDVATDLATSNMSWLVSQQVRNVLGTGPVPTFAPPYRPFGPVVHGRVLSTGGHFP